ncbi:hypothetical protein JOC54_003151 [Alkalihalobacillus xiaoxiensis]|uniref:DNA-binding protein n=1 Tax=Shouchella xiaoxiensis TaxID=766895 RepID=A0ABS2SWG5_9BACI|nr:hypothetical protein [Shouchella xiaoxiensis]
MIFKEKASVIKSFSKPLLDLNDIAFLMELSIYEVRELFRRDATFPNPLKYENRLTPLFVKEEVYSYYMKRKQIKRKFH